jgi:probable F420-dependent oxidoreductase
MGPQSTRDTITRCVQSAERCGLEDIWIQDHLAIPPDDAEGSDGRYLDPLTTLAYLAALTERISLGTGVLNLPYRAALPTAKAVATVQELSGGRLQLGVGIGWMRSEFQALGIDRRHRGRSSDETLELLHRCFENDEVVINGQPFLFRPRPKRPRILVGGSPPHALERAVRFGDGWLPMGGDPDNLRDPIRELNARAAEAGRSALEVRVLAPLPLSDPAAAVDRVEALFAAGCTGVIHALRYEDASEFERATEALAEHILPLFASEAPGATGSQSG